MADCSLRPYQGRSQTTRTPEPFHALDYVLCVVVYFLVSIAMASNDRLASFTSMRLWPTVHDVLLDSIEGETYMEEAAAILVQTLFSQNSVDLSVRNLMSAKTSEGPEAVATFLGKYWLAMFKELLSQKETLAVLA